MKIRRIIALLMASAWLLCAAGCGQKKEGFSSDSLCLNCGGTAYRVGEKADKLLSALGTPSNVISQTSCHYGENGDEYTYEYYFSDLPISPATVSASDGTAIPDGSVELLRIHTVPLRPGQQYICDIDCCTSRYSTDKGITAGSGKADMIKAYGSGFVDEGGGYFTYYDGEPLPDTPRLMFYIENDKVVFFSISAAINF